MFDEILKISILYDFYGKLLNEKQATIIDLYYNQDLSLGEIGELLSISRQGVYDTLKRAQSNLFRYEKKLKLVEKFNIYNKSAEKIIEYTSMIKEDKYKYILLNIKKEAKQILGEIQEENSDF